MNCSKSLYALFTRMSLAQLWDEWIAKAQERTVNEIVISMNSEWQLRL